MRTFPLVPALLACLLLGACMESADTVVLNKDGSGTVASRYVVDQKKTDDLLVQLIELARMMDPNMAGKDMKKPEGDPLHPNWFKDLARRTEGYDVTRAEQTQVEGLRTTTVEATFKSLEAAARGQAFYAATVTLARVEKSEQCPKGAWRLTFDDLGAVRALLPPQVDFEQARMAMQGFDAQLGMLDLRRTLTLPTPVLETNGAKSEDGRQVTWSVTFKSIVEGKPVTMEVVFEDAEGLTLTPFTYAPNVRELQRRMGAKPPEPPAEETPEGGEPKPGEGDAPKAPEKPAGG
jgi:hypothetical protein